MAEAEEKFLFTLDGKQPRDVYVRPDTGIVHIRSTFGADEYKREYPAFVDSYRQLGFVEKVRDRFHRLQASVYVPSRGRWAELMARIATPVPRVERTGTFLDVGCNTGSLLSKLPPAWKRYGVEINAEAAQEARRHGNIEVFEGPLEKFETDVKFDFIRVSHVVEHLEDYEGFLRKVYDLLAPGGYALFYTPNTASPTYRVFGRYWQPFYEQTHVYLFSLENLTSVCERIGFEVVEAGTYYMGLWADSLLRALHVPESSPVFKVAFFALMFSLYPIGLLVGRFRKSSVLYLYVRRPAVPA